jgi:hypothetical protein
MDTSGFAVVFQNKARLSRRAYIRKTAVQMNMFGASVQTLMNLQI